MKHKLGLATIAVVIVVALIVLVGLCYVMNKRSSSHGSVKAVGENTVIPSTVATTTAPLPTQVNGTAVNSSDVDQESFTRQPGAIVSVSKNVNGWVLGVDLLTQNSKFNPGVDDEPFFINQNPKIRDLHVTHATKAYKCNGATDASYMETTPAELLVIIQAKEGEKTGYFDITGSFIIGVYQQCLP